MIKKILTNINQFVRFSVFVCVLHISITSTRTFILSRADSFRDFICSHNFGFHCMKLRQHKITELTKWHNFFFERREKMCMKRYRQLIVSSKLELRYTILSRNRMTNVNNGNDKNWKHPIFCQPKICYWNRLIQFFFRSDATSNPSPQTSVHI